MLRRGATVVLFLVLMPATVQAFDHHHSSSHGSSGDGCNSSSSSSSSSTSGSSTSAPVPLPSPSGHKVVFVTSTTYSGAVGGLTAADTYCQDSASASGLAGLFRAWLSDDTSDAFDRAAGAGPWYTTADNLAFSTREALRGAPNAELLDENGSPPTATSGAWSGSDARGVSTGENCNGWSNASGDAVATTGTALGNDAAWGGGGTPLHCNDKAPLICVQR